jgi:polyisoprenoid-binding protein YceI
MTRILILTGFILSFSGVFSQKVWKITEQESSITFTKVDDEVQGKLTGLKATIQLDLDNASLGKLTASIPLKTLRTDDSERDSHLMTDEFFHQKKFPEILFESTSIFKTKSGFLAKGTLTIKDISRDVVMPFVYDAKLKKFIGRIKLHTAHYGVMGKPAAEDAWNTVVRIEVKAI